MNTLRTLSSAVALVVLASPLLGEESKPPAFVPSTSGKKLIEYGWDCPTTSYVRANIAEMEKRPFDGIVIKVTKTRDPAKTGTGDTLGWNVFGKTAFAPEDYQHAIEDIQATQFQKFTHNFIQVISMQGIDWFDPDWGAVTHNVSVLARVAKAGGCVGLVFDPEQYGPQKMWTYIALPEARRAEVSKEQYLAKVKERGGEFMRAINAEFPNVRILCLFGPSLALKGRFDPYSPYDLLPSFIEGMCLAADSGTEIIDGFEQSYGYNSKEAFETGRKMMATSRGLFKNTEIFDRVMRMGFGLWLDNQSHIASRKGWFPGEPSKNHFQPTTWKTAVHSALANSDCYVWIYSERLNWWKGGVGDAYEKVLVEEQMGASTAVNPEATAAR